MRRINSIQRTLKGAGRPESQFRCTLDGLLEGVQIIRFDWTYLYLNPAAARHARRMPQELIGKKMAEVFPNIRRTEVFQALQTCMAKRTRKRLETEFTFPDGSKATFEISIEPAPEGLIVFSNDITERRRAENERAEAAVLLARAQELASVGTYEINFDPAVPWSTQKMRIVGPQTFGEPMTADEYVSQWVHPADREHVRQLLENAFRNGARYEAEYRLVRPDGAARYVHSMAEPLRGHGGKILKYVGAIQDVTERRHLEREVLRISEHERGQIGRDLHDGLCQDLAAIEFRVIELKFAAQRRSKHCAAELEKIAKSVRDAIAETRTIARGLSPVKIGADGLMKALRELAESTQKNFKIACAFHYPASVAIHDNVVATHLYRIAQEAVQNAIRHGKAQRIDIELFKQNARIVVGVKDNGVGLAPKRKNGGLGLRIMQYRAGAVHGSLVVQHGPQGGTEVICSLDAPNDEERPRRFKQRSTTTPRIARA
jgi:PAS domain S-box-containing protein